MRHPVALWAATSAGFGSLAGVVTADLLTNDKVFEKGFAAFIAAAIVGGTVYASERLKEERRRSGD